MKKELSEKEACVKAEAYCSAAERCRMDVVGKLHQWGVSETWVESIVSHLEKEGFLNGLRYAKAFVRDKYRFNQWGRIKITQALRLKQVASSEIGLALQEIDDEEYSEILGKLLVKKMKSVKAATIYERNGKLVRFAAGHGYELDEILDCLKRLGCEDETFG